MVQVVHDATQTAFDLNEVHHHAILTDVAMDAQADHVCMTVQPAALLMASYEMACGELDVGVLAIDLESHCPTCCQYRPHLLMLPG